MKELKLKLPLPGQPSEDSMCFLRIIYSLERDSLRCNCSNACQETLYPVSISTSKWPATNYRVKLAPSQHKIRHYLILPESCRGPICAQVP